MVIIFIALKTILPCFYILDGCTFTSWVLSPFKVCAINAKVKENVGMDKLFCDGAILTCKGLYMI